MGALAGGFIVTVATLGAQSQDPASRLEERVKALEGVVDTAAIPAGKGRIVAGNNAWMPTSAALVLLMTGPGLALFYGGLVRPKNAPSTFMLFRLMFAIIMPALISGAFAERIKFGAMGAFTVLWATFVILKALRATIGLRPPEQEEPQGLDLSLHGEQAYHG